MYNTDAKIVLKDSLCQLLEKNPINNISVKQIASHCGVSTRTFYNYFTDKYDLMHFLYYYEVENVWFDHKKLHGCEEALKLLYYRWSNLLNQLYHTYSYVGQNDMRSFVIRKTLNDLYRIVICNRKEQLLKNRSNIEALYLLALAIQSAHEEYMKHRPVITLHADVFTSIIPSTLYEALTRTPEAPYPEEIEIFDPENPSWPPKIYFSEDR